MEITDQALVERLDALINGGNYTEAHEVGQQYTLTNRTHQDRISISAQVWLRLMLVANLLGLQAYLEYREMARQAPDYSPLAEGDFRRVEMLRAIRNGKMFRAQGLRKLIVELHRHDPERMLAYWEVVVTFHTARGHHVKAQRTRDMIDGHRRKLERQASR